MLVALSSRGLVPALPSTDAARAGLADDSHLVRRERVWLEVKPALNRRHEPARILTRDHGTAGDIVPPL